MVRLAERKRSLFLSHHGGLRASPIVGADVDEVREIKDERRTRALLFHASESRDHALE